MEEKILQKIKTTVSQSVQCHLPALLLGKEKKKNEEGRIICLIKLFN